MRNIRPLFVVCICLAVLAAASAYAEGAKKPSELKDEVIKLMNADVDEETIVEHVRQIKLTAQLSTDDILAWKNAGIPQKIIKAALAKPLADPLEDFRVIPFSEDLVPLDIVINPVHFHSVIAVKKPPRGRHHSLYIDVKGSNLGRKDYFGIVKATLLSETGEVISVLTKKRAIEEGNSKKTISIRFYELTEDQISAIAKYKLEFSVLRD